MERTKSPLQQVADELEIEQIKKKLTERLKLIESLIYENIRKEMKTKEFNEILGKVIEKHGVSDSLCILSETIQSVANESLLTLIKKNKN